MNSSKSTAACIEIKEEFDDAMNTSLDGWNLLDKVPGENSQKSPNLGRSSAAANDSNSRLPNEPFVEKGTILEQFNQLMNQQRLLLFGRLDKLQRHLEEGKAKILKEYEGWQLKMSEVRVKANKAMEEIEAIQAYNRAVLASIESTSGIVSDSQYPNSSSNQVPSE